MRILKFRVWDHINKELVYDDVFYQDADNGFFAGSNINGDWVQFEIIEQYTGLKDRNGKEIYEGDVVKIYEIGGYIEVPVIFKDGAFTMDGRPFFKVIGVYNPLYEIIGNIHEEKT